MGGMVVWMIVCKRYFLLVLLEKIIPNMLIAGHVLRIFWNQLVNNGEYGEFYDVFVSPIGTVSR